MTDCMSETIKAWRLVVLLFIRMIMQPSGAFAGGELIAIDAAEDAVYNNGWTAGDNGGSGFGAWEFDRSATGVAAIGDSSGLHPSVDINSAGESFRIASVSGYTHTWRDFSSPLAEGDTFSMTFAAGLAASNKGLDLRTIGTNRDGGNQVNLASRSGTSSGTWYISANGGTKQFFANGPHANTWFDVSVTQTSAAGGTYSVTRHGAYTQTLTGTYVGVIGNVKVYGSTGGTTDADAVYFNELSIEIPPYVPVSYYVATHGNDTGSGTFADPFRTIQKAADLAIAGDTVYIRAGTYHETVVPGNSGSESNYISFIAYNDEEVILAAGDPVTGWTVHAGDIWKAGCNWGMGSGGEGDTCFVNSELKYEAREGAETDPMDINDWTRVEKADVTSTYFSADTLKGKGNDYWNGAKVRFHQNDWTIQTKIITDYDSASGRISYGDIGGISLKHWIGCYIYGTINALDRSGEWFKDTAADTLYYQVEPGQDPNVLNIEFRRRAYLFDVSGRDYIRISGLTLRGAFIEMDGSTDRNLFEGLTVCNYDMGNYGRMFFEGSHNTLRDSEVFDTWGCVATVNGENHEIVNNYFHGISHHGLGNVLIMGGSGHLVAYNTVRKFARSFLSGYPNRSEFAYNLFEDGGRLSWDTGIFDGDSGRGNGGGCIVHHNVFRNSNPLGIYAASYAGLEYVHHHNIIHDVGDTYFTYRLGQLQFAKFYHNTFIGAAPEGDVNAAGYAYESAYNNNLQVSVEDCATLGVDFRGNVDYSPSDFVDFNSRDLRLAPGSAAIDAGIVLPDINDGYAGAAPDAGALEYGEAMWPVGHDFANPPNPAYSWTALPGSNLFEDNIFNLSLVGWTYTGSPTRFNGNTWNTLNVGLANSGQYSVRILPGEGMRREFTELEPNTAYTVAVEARLVDQRIECEQYDGISGAVSAANYRDENYVTGLSDGEWLRYDNVNFGSAGKYDQLELTYSRPGHTRPDYDAVSIEVRDGSVTGPVLATFEFDPFIAESWYVTRVDIGPVSGLHDLCFLAKGPGAANLQLANVRLQKRNIEPDHKLTVEARGFGGSDITTRVGHSLWKTEYETFSFTTGPTADSVELVFQNDGLYDAYMDRLALYKKADLAVDSAAAGVTGQSSDYAGRVAARAIDANLSSYAMTAYEANAWWEVDLGALKEIHGIRLTGSDNASAALGHFRVTVWDDAPGYGSSPVWSRDYFETVTLAAGEVLAIKDTELSADGSTRLGDLRGRYVRVQLLSQNHLALAEGSVLTFDETDLSASDADIARGTDYWQASFVREINIGEILLTNVGDETYPELSNFRISVWDAAPSDGGSMVWSKDYFAAGSVGRGEAFSIRGDDIGADGSTRLASVLGRVVRVELNGTNNAGNNNLTFADISIRHGAAVPPVQNVALRGEAKQSSNHYSTYALAEMGINGIVNPEGDLAIAIRASDAWWQVDLLEPRPIDQIVAFVSPVTGNFRVSVWDGDPEMGASELWGRNFYKGGFGFDGPDTLRINGDVISGGLRLDQVIGARVVRVQMIQYEQFGVSEVQVWDSSALPVPDDRSIRIEAEDYETYFDITAGNAGGAYRDDDVDIEARDDGYNVGWVNAGEWLEYAVDLPAGTYDLEARVSAITTGRTFSAALDGIAVAGISVPNTGGWGVFHTVTVPNVVVTDSGVHQLHLDFPVDGMNLNWVAFVPQGSDGDDDGMRDDWEAEAFNDLDSLPNEDEDGDGFLNAHEYIALTDPNDSNSWFRVLIDGDSISWQGAEERVYTVLRTEDLTMPLAELESGILFPQINFVDPDGLSNAFYRVEVSLP